MPLLRFFLLICVLCLNSLQAAEKTVIQLKWFHQFQFAGYYAAIEQGYYADAGLEVVLRERDPDTDPVDDVLAGKADYGITDSGLILAALQGKPVVLVAQVFQHSPLVLMTRRKDNINNVFELSGKKITTEPSGITDTPIIAMLLNSLGSLDKVEIQPYSYRYEDLIEGKTDALAGYLTDQPYFFHERGLDIDIIDPRDYGIDFYGDNLFTNLSESLANPERIKKIRQATLLGWEYALENSDELIELILQKYNTQDMTRSRLESEAKAIRKLILDQYIQLGSYQTSRFDKIAEIYSDFGFVDNILLPVSFYFDQDSERVELNREERTFLQRNRKLRVALIEDQPPLSFTEDDTAKGYLNDLFRKVAQILNLEFEFIRGMTYAETLSALQNRKVDILNDYSAYGDSRDYLLETQPVLSVSFVAVGKSNGPPIYRIQDLQDKRIVLVQGFQQTRTIQETYPELNIQLVGNIHEAYRMLRNNEADYYIDNATHASFFLESSLVRDLKIAGELSENEMGKLELRFANRSDQPELNSALRKALRGIQSSSLQNMRRAWLPDNYRPTEISFTPEELAWLKEHPRIRVVLDPDWAPIEYQDDSGQYHGISLDYLDELEQILNVRFEIASDLTWAEGIQAIKNKEADMFASVAKTPERTTYSVFTDPYVAMPIRIFSSNERSYIGSLDNLAGKSVSVADGYAIHDWLKSQHPELNLLPVTTPAEGLMLASKGKVDAFIGNVVTANYYINKLDLDNIRTTGDTPYANNQAMAVRNDWPILAGILNKALKSMPLYQHNAIFNRWMSVRFEHQADYRLIAWVILASFLLLAAVFIWNRSLKIQVENRTRIIIEEENKYSTLIETTSEGFWMVNTQGDTLDVNESLCRMLGYQRDQLLGTPLTNYCDAYNRSILEGYASNFEESDHRSYEINLTHHNGQHVPVIFEATVLRDLDQEIIGVFIFVTSIATQKEMENRLRTSEKSFRSLVESSPMPMLVIDNSSAHNIQLMNNRFSEIFGYDSNSFSDLAGCWLKALPDTNYRQLILALWEHTINNLKDTGQTSIIPIAAEFTCANGKHCHVEVSMTLLPSSGLMVFSDVSERKRREEMAILHQELTDLVEQGDTAHLMRKTLDTAERLTQSQIGLFHLIDENQESIPLQVWSTRTQKEFCYTQTEELHAPISQAGLWSECILQRKAIIHNEFITPENQQRVPDGHPQMQREALVPLFRDGQIVAVFGVGNKPLDYDEEDIDLITRIGNLGYDFYERKKTKQQIEHMAFYDILTGLPNRELLADRLNQAISLTHRSKQILAVCYLDLDGFKPVNDQHGHHIGDALLVELANRLNRDLREGDTLARLGGDEFVILLNGLHSIANGEDIIKRILHTISQPFHIDQLRIMVSGSMGVTFAPLDNVEADALIRHADQAMYVAKANGKSTYHLYDTVDEIKNQQHQQQLAEFDHALNNDELILHFQPKVNLGNGEVIGFEALTRWQHPDKGILHPGMFLEQIEGSPQEIALGEWVLKRALDQHLHWRAQLGKKLSVSVNISPRHIQMTDFFSQIELLLKQYPDDISNYLELEILETTAIGDTTKVADIMANCSALGIHFSLDDFGTGYSSLTYFHRLPIDILKIDQRFVRDMLDDERDLDIVEGVLRLADALNRPVVAEGVESVEVGMMLLQLGCRYAQGYAIAKPMPAKNIPEWLQQWNGNSIWHELPHETMGLPELYDLNVSIFSHRKWLEVVTHALDHATLDELPDLKENSCQFSRWYKGIGHSRYGTHPKYKKIGLIHQKVHQLAQQIKQEKMINKNTPINNDLLLLQQQGKELIDNLQHLADKPDSESGEITS